MMRSCFLSVSSLRRGLARRYRAAAGLGLVLLPGALSAQTIRGTVLESGGTDPIEGATIDLLWPDSTLVRSAMSGRRGWFHLEADKEGSYLIRSSHPSYTAEKIDTVTIEKDEVVTVVLRMGPAAIPLAPLLVTARSHDRLSGFFDRAERGRPGRYLRREDIERRRAALASQLLRMTPGIIIEPADDGLSDIITMRGPAGRCPADIFLDGLPVPQDIGMSVDDFTSPENLEGVEIYDAYTIPPPEFNLTRNECGVVAFWSKRSAFRPLTWKRLGLAAIIGSIIVLGSRIF